MIIRKANESDSSAIVKLLEQLDFKNTEMFIKDKIKKFSNDENEMIFVAEENEIIYGFMSFHFIPQLALEGDVARISYFCVDKNSRSKGIGNLLEKQCVSIASERKCDSIEVHCHSRRNNAHRFYIRQGFVEEPKYFVKKI